MDLSLHSLTLSELSAADKRWNEFSNALLDVHRKKIKLDDLETKTAMSIYSQIKGHMQKELKCKFWGILSPEFNPRGSYFTGVKVGKADEFDVDIAFKLPVDFSLLRVQMGEPGFVKIFIIDAFNKSAKDPSWKNKYGFLEEWIDEDGYLSCSKFIQSVHSLFTNIFQNKLINIGNNSLKVTFRKSGPAFTAMVDGKLDIDFVFVFKFPEKKWPSGLTKMFTPPPKFDHNYWFAVPKKSLSDDPKLWRLSFPFQEAYILEKNQNLKTIYRFLKALRDENNINLCSYHIATLFLWEEHERRTKNKKNNFWSNNVGFLFICMLDRLISCLNLKKINFYWDRKANMIEFMNDANIMNIKGNLQNIRKSILKAIVSGDSDIIRDDVNKHFKC